MFLIYNYLMDPLPVKLVIVGDGAVGKTSLLFRCVLFYSATLRTSSPESTSPPFSITTLLRLKLMGGSSILVCGTVGLRLRDTAGQEEYSKLRPLAYTNADIFLITFSVVDRSSFYNVIKKVVF